MKIKTALCALACLAVVGCSDGLKEKIGLSKRSPDEFSVVTRAPLSLPPDFNLRPPRPGAVRPQEGTAQLRARRAIFPLDGTTRIADLRSDFQSEGFSASEASFLTRIGAHDNPDDIRARIDRETRRIVRADDDFTDRLIFWKEAEEPGVVVDAAAESRRLQENSALGTRGAGETPTISRESKAPLEDVF